MHSILELGANVPAFLAKLWRLVDDPDTNDLICWSEDGTSFYIRDQAQFSRKLLPMYYKHNNMASFIRQLNMYGFHKIVAADAGSLRLDRDEMEFAHQCFLRGHPYLLEHIKRKNQLLSSKQLDESRVSGGGGTVVRADIMNKLLNEVKHMRGRQETVETRLSNMKQENEALWRELSLLRQKHMKQQTIVNKLIQFLVTLVQPSQRLNAKRRYPLMINNVAHSTNDTKIQSKLGSSLAGSNSNKSQGRRLYTVVLPNNQAQSASSTTIHELDSDMLLGDTEEMLDPSITLEDPEDELSNLPDTDDLSSSVILGELTDNLASGTAITLLPVEEETSTAQVLEGSAAASTPNVTSVANQDGGAISILPSDILLGVDPMDVNPAIVVPGLQKRKTQQKGVNQIQQAVAPTASITQSTSAPRPLAVTTRSVASNLSTSKGNGAPAASAAPSSFASKNAAAAAAAAVEKAVAAIKKEPRITSNRSRKRKTSQPKQAGQNNGGQVPQATMEPVDLLAEVGLVSPAPTLLAEQDGSPMSASTPAASPLVAYPALSPARSPMSPLERPFSTDLALACTSQDNSTVPSTAVVQSPRTEQLNREELDGHCDTLDSELGQLKDLLHNSGFSLDASTLLGLFNPDESLPFNLPHDNDVRDLIEDPIGNELTMYGAPEDFPYIDRRPGSSTPPPLGDGGDINTPVLTPASPGFSSVMEDPKRRKV